MELDDRIFYSNILVIPITQEDFRYPFDSNRNKL